ncbi:Immunoglobulin omega chain [Tupaia chinensis]|nr:Immunoglobulin omega chain [Tupaia chinensis]
MAWTPVLLMLLSYCTGSLSQPVVAQPPSPSASPGASTRLTCTLSNGFSVIDFGLCWYQQKPESPPCYLLQYDTDSNKHQGSRVPSLFSGSKDTSANAGVLQISVLQPEDEANYYCNIWHENSKASTVLQTLEAVRQKSPFCSSAAVTPARKFIKMFYSFLFNDFKIVNGHAYIPESGREPPMRCGQAVILFPPRHHLIRLGGAHTSVPTVFFNPHEPGLKTRSFRTPLYTSPFSISLGDFLWQRNSLSVESTVQTFHTRAWACSILEICVCLGFLVLQTTINSCIL